MSWVEDEGIDAWDFEDIRDYDHEANWEAGFHETKDGKEIKLWRIKDSHLANMINYFSQRGYNVSLLEMEQVRREKLIAKNFEV